MKTKFTLSILILLIGVVFVNNTVINVGAQTEPTPGKQCDNPTQEVTIVAGPGVKFKTDEIKVERNTCVKITLDNKDAVIHDFVIDGVDGEIETVYIKADPGQSASFNVTTPDLDKTYDYYCWQQGHRAAGMEGGFVVGEGSPEKDAPGFEFLYAFAAIAALAVIVPKLRNNKVKQL